MTHAEVYRMWAENTDMRKRVRCGRVSFNGRAALLCRRVVAAKFPDLCGGTETLCVAIGGPRANVFARDIGGAYIPLGLGGVGFVEALQSLGQVRAVWLPIFFLDESRPELTGASIASYDGLMRCVAIMDAVAARYVRHLRYLMEAHLFCRGEFSDFIKLVGARNRLCGALGEPERPETDFLPDVAARLRDTFPNGSVEVAARYYGSPGGLSCSGVNYYDDCEVRHCISSTDNV